MGYGAIDRDEGGLLKDIECFALDMDGTIYLGEQWIEGAGEFLEEIEKRGKRYVFLTNNSSKSPEVYVEKLKRMGLEVGADKIITSGQAAISYLKKHYAGKRVFLLGNELLQREFREEGIVLATEAAEVVVTAFDTTLDYGKMCKVCDLVRAGLPYIATHPDYNCPTADGFIPDAGAIHAFIYASAGRYPDRVIGKPNGDIVDGRRPALHGYCGGKEARAEKCACAERGIFRRRCGKIGGEAGSDFSVGAGNDSLSVKGDGINAAMQRRSDAAMQLNSHAAA